MGHSHSSTKANQSHAPSPLSPPTNSGRRPGLATSKSSQKSSPEQAVSASFFSSTRGQSCVMMPWLAACHVSAQCSQPPRKDLSIKSKHVHIYSQQQPAAASHPCPLLLRHAPARPAAAAMARRRHPQAPVGPPRPPGRQAAAITAPRARRRSSSARPRPPQRQEQEQGQERQQRPWRWPAARPRATCCAPRHRACRSGGAPSTPRR